MRGPLHLAVLFFFFATLPGMSQPHGVIACEESAGTESSDSGRQCPVDEERGSSEEEEFEVEISRGDHVARDAHSMSVAKTWWRVQGIPPSFASSALYRPPIV